tara:strand:- start:187 stop:759 length:573 start_codon:yes stop_codon:yes gene_type:complete
MAISGNSKIPGYMIEGMAAGGYRAAKRLINKYNNSGDAKEIAIEGIAGMSGKPTGVTSVDDDLASLNPISKPGATPWQVDDYNKSKWTKPGVRIPELNPTTEYGGNYSESTRFEPLVQRMHKAFIQNRVNEGAARTEPVMDLNIGGPKEVPGVETGWIQQNDRLEYRPEVPADKKTRRKTNRLKKKKARY